MHAAAVTESAHLRKPSCILTSIVSPTHAKAVSGSAAGTPREARALAVIDSAGPAAPLMAAVLVLIAAIERQRRSVPIDTAYGACRGLIHMSK